MARSCEAFVAYLNSISMSITLTQNPADSNCVPCVSRVDFGNRLTQAARAQGRGWTGG